MAEGYIYRSQGKQHGPVSSAELRQLAANGTIQPTDLVSKEGTGKWVAAMAVEGLIPRAAPPTAAPSTTTQGPSTAELLQRDLQNIKGLANRVLPSKRDRDLALSRLTVLVLAALAFSIPVVQMMFMGPESMPAVGILMLLWTLLVVGMLVVGTIQKHRGILVLACRMSIANWLFLLISNAPFVFPLFGTVFSAAAGYWALSVLNRSDVKEYYASFNARPGTTAP